MGLNLSYLNFIYSVVGDFKGKRLLELGNQRFSGNKTGKEYFVKEANVLEHISVDMNGLDESLPLDLSKPELFTKWNNYFDIITNCGTTEHIEPFEAQYNVFSILHNCLKPNGIMVHILPDADELKISTEWANHCNYFYSKSFFKMLEKENSYKLFPIRKMNHLICVGVQKINEGLFMDNKEKFLSYIKRRSNE